MTREGPGQRKVLQPPCAPHPLLTHPSRTVAPIPAFGTAREGWVPPALGRKTHYDSNVLLNHKNSVLLCPMIFAIVLTIIGIVAAYVCGSRRFSTIWRMCTSSFGKWPLFVVIVVWVLFALLVFTVLGWLWGRSGYWSWQRWLTNWRSVGTEAASLELVKISLTTIGGIGGVGYLVIKYRERASAERGAADARLPWSIEQLANKSPQIRIAAIYSLADIADIYRGNFRQRVVNVLCGYLRTKRGD